MRQDCPNELHYFTLPKDALDIFGNLPNETLFSGRHSYLLSSPESKGEIETVIVNKRLGAGLINMSGPQNTLREQGIYQHGADTVMLKQPTRQLVLDMTIKGSDRIDFLQAREDLGYILGVDQATQVDHVDPTDLGDPFQFPLPWTYTHESALGRRHFDFASSWMDGDDDIDDPSNLQNDFVLTLSGDDPTFYADEIVLEGRVLLEATPNPDPSVAPSTFIIPEIIYQGNARTCFYLSIRLQNMRPSDTFFALGLVDLISGRYRRFSYVDFPASGWPGSHGVGNNVVVWDTCSKQLLSVDGTTGTTITQLDLSASPAGTKNWNAFQFVPKRRYGITLEVSADSQIIYELRYFPRYGMV